MRILIISRVYHPIFGGEERVEQEHQKLLAPKTPSQFLTVL